MIHFGAALGIGIAAGFPLWKYVSLRRKWRRSAERLGLEDQGTWLEPCLLRGSVAGAAHRLGLDLPDTLALSRRQILLQGRMAHSGSVSIQIECSPGEEFDVSIVPRLSAGWPGGDRARLSGFDEEWENLFRVRARDPHAGLAWLNGKNRERIAMVWHRGWSLHVSRHGVALARIYSLLGGEDLEAFLKAFLELVKDFPADEESILDGLERNALADPVNAARLKNLEAFLARDGGSERASGLCRKLLNDPDEAVWLRAAVALGPEGRPALLRALGMRFLHPEKPAKAFEGALERANETELETLITGGLASPHWEVRQVALEGIAAYQLRPALPLILRLAREGDERTRLHVIGVLQHLNDPACEPDLIEWLKTTDDAVRTAAAVVLGQLGTVAAVEPLLACVEGFFAPSELKRATREAVAKIQSRLGQVARGTLSLADTPGPQGAVSLAPQGGELSTPEEQPK